MCFIKYIIYIIRMANEYNEKNKIGAIAVLTRGYQNLQQYNTLIQRNISIAKNIGNILNSIDILIFHEGNILDTHQQYISKGTPLLNLKFICIKEHAFNDDKKTISFFEIRVLILNLEKVELFSQKRNLKYSILLSNFTLME